MANGIKMVLEDESKPLSVYHRIPPFFLSFGASFPTARPPSPTANQTRQPSLLEAMERFGPYH